MALAERGGREEASGKGPQKWVRGVGEWGGSQRETVYLGLILGLVPITAKGPEK